MIQTRNLFFLSHVRGMEDFLFFPSCHSCMRWWLVSPIFSPTWTAHPARSCSPTRVAGCSPTSRVPWSTLVSPPRPTVRPSSNHPVKLGSYSSSWNCLACPRGHDAVNCVHIPRFLSLYLSDASPTSLSLPHARIPASARELAKLGGPQPASAAARPASPRQRSLWPCSAGVEAAPPPRHTCQRHPCRSTAVARPSTSRRVSALSFVPWSARLSRALRLGPRLSCVRPPTQPPRHAPRAVASCLASSLLPHLTVVRRASPCCAAARRVVVVHHPPRARPVVTHGLAGARRAVNVRTEVSIVYAMITLFPYVTHFK
jgi:hypothetical protein